MFGTVYVCLIRCIIIIFSLFFSMKQIFYSLQTMLNAKWTNFIKIISVSLGLFATLLLFLFSAYNHSFDKCYKDYDNLYQLWMIWNIDGKENVPSQKCIGKLAGGVFEEMNDVIESAATCIRSGSILYSDNKEFEAQTICADSLFFQTMGIETLSGNPIQDLSLPSTIYLSDYLAHEMFGDENPIGKIVSLDKTEILTVKGVYKGLPNNITLNHDAVISLPTIWGRYGNYSWSGGDSWNEYIRLKKDVSVSHENLLMRINNVLQANAPDTEDVKIRVDARPITDTYFSDSRVKQEDIIISILALILFLTTIFNYILITLASLSRRTKAVGVHKCCGATDGSILRMFLWETTIVMFISIILIILFCFVMQRFMTTVTLGQLLTSDRLWIVIVIFALFFLIGGVVPGRIFSRIPVTQVFRRFTENKKAWKRVLLFSEFSCTAFITGVLAISTIQHSFLMDYDVGYDSDCLAYGFVNKECADWLESRQYVKAVTNSASMPIWGYSGAMMRNESGKTMFSTRYDFIWPNYFDVMGIQLIKGRMPNAPTEIVVNERFVREMLWNDSVIGRTIPNTEFYDMMTVVGVCRDFNIGGFIGEQKPIALLPNLNKNMYDVTVVRLNQPVKENLKRLNAELEEAFPGRDMQFYDMGALVKNSFAPLREFRNYVLVITLIIMFITVIGMTGFVRDEVQRRRKEIAIRRVNGADSSTIIDMFVSSTLKIAIPATVLGSVGAWICGQYIVGMFSIKPNYSNAIYILSALVVLILIALMVVMLIWKASRENPVNNLKSE